VLKTFNLLHKCAGDPLNHGLPLVRPNLIMDLNLKGNQVKIQSHSFPRIDLRMNDLKMDPKDHFVLKRKKAGDSQDPFSYKSTYRG
jgi:hypothetical protein